MIRDYSSTDIGIISNFLFQYDYEGFVMRSN